MATVDNYAHSDDASVPTLGGKTRVKPVCVTATEFAAYTASAAREKERVAILRYRSTG